MRNTPPIGSQTLIFYVCSCLIGCAGGDQTQSSVTVRDSAGIRIIENGAPLWKHGTEWRVGSVYARDIGGDPSDASQQFLRLSRVHGLKNGDVVLVNQGANALVVFDSTGQFRHSLGRPGKGPGEYGSLGNVVTCSDDSVVILDGLRILWFSDGQYARTEVLQSRFSGESVLRPWSVASNCETFLFSASRNQVPPAGKSVRSTVRLFWGGTQPDAPLHTIGDFPTLQVVTRVISGMNQTLPLPWGADIVWAVSGNRIFIGSNDAPEIRVFEIEKGLVQVIRWPAVPDPITAADRQIYEEKRARWLTKYPQIAEVMPPLDQYPELPEYKPLFRTFLFDEIGSLWVRSYSARLAGRPDRYDFQMGLWDSARPGDPPETWIVFDQSGRLLGNVRVPSDIDVRTFHNGQLIGVWKDQLDVEHVRWYPLARFAQ